MDFNLLLALTGWLVLVCCIFGYWFTRDTNKRKRLVQKLVANPAMLSALRRDGPDGDGYVRLYARLADGKEVLVADYVELETVENQLRAAMAAK